MIKTLYHVFQKWSEKGSVYLLSDLHFEDSDCKLMDKNWITPEEQIKLINKKVSKNDTFICLGDVGNPEWVYKIRGYKVLITGNHDKGSEVYKKYFDEVYNGPLVISNKLLLSHEPLLTPFMLNIHGHNHSVNDKYDYINDVCVGINIAANVVNFNPINLKEVINKGYLSKIKSIHRNTIDHARKNPIKK